MPRPVYIEATLRDGAPSYKATAYAHDGAMFTDRARSEANALDQLRAKVQAYEASLVVQGYPKTIEVDW